MNLSQNNDYPSECGTPEIRQLLLCHSSTDAFEKPLLTLDPEIVDHITSCPTCFPLYVQSNRGKRHKQEPEIDTSRLDKKVHHRLRWIILEEMLDQRLKQLQDIMPFAFSMPVSAILRGISPPLPDTEITKTPFDLNAIYATIAEHPPRIFELNLCCLSTNVHDLTQLHYSRDPYKPERLVIRLHGLNPELTEYDAYLVSTPMFHLQAFTDSTDPEILIGIIREKLEKLAQGPDQAIVDLFAGIFDQSLVIFPQISSAGEGSDTGCFEFTIDAVTSALLANTSRLNFLVFGSEYLLG